MGWKAAALVGRIPIQLTPQQSLLVGGLAIGLLIALALLVFAEWLFGGVIGALLRLFGQTGPDRNAISSALDELEERLRDRRG